MKPLLELPRTAAFTALVVLNCGGAAAQRPGAGTPPGCAASASAADTATMLDTLVQGYGSLVVYDRNLNGRVDETERAELTSAIRQGRLRPEGATGRPAVPGSAPAEVVAQRVAMRYERLAAYDTNRDGHLDAAERERLKAELQSGKALPCGRPG